MKTYFILYSDFSEESVKADSVHSTSKLISFYRRKTLVLAVPVSEFRRIGLTKYQMQSFDQENDESEALKSARTYLAKRWNSTTAALS